MVKCVRVVLGNVSDIEEFYALLKKQVVADAVEGTATPTKDNGIDIVVHGNKEQVDAFVDAVEEIAVKQSLKKKQEISFFVEPHLKEEDYRGLFRFIKKTTT